MKKYILIFLVLSSCRVAKKDWVKENFSERTEVEKLIKSSVQETKSEISKIETSLSKIETSVSKSETLSGSSSENETTTISGSITAEEGKEKSATVGNTTITSNGANIYFETSTSKSISQAFENKYLELESLLQEKEVTILEIESQLTSVKNELSSFRALYESEKTTKSKTVKKTGFQFGVWMIIIIIIIILILLWYFRKSIPLLK